MSRMRSNHRKHTPFFSRDLLHQIAEVIWGPPDEACPKCKSIATEYYDPFFFSPVRTLSGKRRIKCPKCGFIWRPSRSKKSPLSKFTPQI